MFLSVCSSHGGLGLQKLFTKTDVLVAENNSPRPLLLGSRPSLSVFIETRFSGEVTCRFLSCETALLLSKSLLVWFSSLCSKKGRDFKAIYSIEKEEAESAETWLYPMASLGAE